METLGLSGVYSLRTAWLSGLLFICDLSNVQPFLSYGSRRWDGYFQHAPTRHITETQRSLLKLNEPSPKEHSYHKSCACEGTRDVLDEVPKTLPCGLRKVRGGMQSWGREIMLDGEREKWSLDRFAISCSAPSAGQAPVQRWLDAHGLGQRTNELDSGSI